MVYVVLGFNSSRSFTLILLPCPLISGTSSCGGETTTFSEAFSSLINSSKLITTFLLFTSIALSAGDAPITFGGASSYHPPSGSPILAHELIIKSKLEKPRSVSKANCNCLWLLIVFCLYMLLLFSLILLFLVLLTPT